MRVTDRAFEDVQPIAPTEIWSIPALPPGVGPPGKRAGGQRIAMDAAPPGAAEVMAWAAEGRFHEGIGFLGYQYLAELSQRPEYRRVSEIIASEATRKWIKLRGKDKDRVSKIEEQLEKFKIRERFRELIELDGFFGRAHLFIDLGVAPGDAELAAPLIMAKEKIGVDSVKNFKVIEPLWSYPGPYNTLSPLAEDFYQPQAWYVMSDTVHASRLLTIIGREVPDMLKPTYAFGGVSLSQMLKPYVDNWLRTRQSVSDLVHSFSTMVLETDMGTALTGGSSNTVVNRAKLFNLMRDNRGLMAIQKEKETLTNVSTPLGTLDKLLAQSQEQMSSIAGIPLVVLLGVTPAGLNASSDGEMRAHYANVKSYQERTCAEPLKTVIDILQLDLDGTIDDTIKFEFLDLWEMDEEAKARLRKSDSDADVALVGAGIVSNEEARERMNEDEESAYFGVDLSGAAPELPTDEADLAALNDNEEEDAPPARKQANDASPFDEGKHPRSKDGKFGSGGTSAGAEPSKAKTKAAIEKFKSAPVTWTSKASGIEYVDNPLPQVARPDMPKVRAQQEALEDAMADGEASDKFFTTAELDPVDLKSLQMTVSRDQVAGVATQGSVNAETNGELPLVIKGPDGLILIDGNHRASAAMITGAKLRAQVFNLDAWEAHKEATKPKPKASSKSDDDALLAELTG
jgi:phage-related protein (TIGR01555 family)